MNRSVLYDELAHYYFNFAHPAWLLEGGASFMSVSTHDRLGLQPLESRLSGLSNRIEAGCLSEEVRNIFDLGEPRFTLQADDRTRCFYLMGERFFIEFSLSLGPDTSAGALRELLQSIYSPERSVPLETKDVVLAWWNNTPPDRREDFRLLFRELHGGPASEFDHFQFRAGIGREYEIRANFELSEMPDARLWLFAPDGMTQIYRFVDQGRTHCGKYLE